MNVVFMASMLPRTPADISGLLSIVLCGPGRFKLDQLGLIFRVRKDTSGCSSCGRSITLGCILTYTSNEKMLSFILLSPDDVMPGLSERVLGN
ncbi:hypothetical protein BDR03DRAFT_209669, partial [Suillus americanus]